MSKKKRKGRKRRYVGLEPSITLTKTAVSMPIVYRSLIPAARTPGASNVVSGMLPTVDASFSMMGLTGLTQAGVGLMDSVKELERMSKKKRRK